MSELNMSDRDNHIQQLQRAIREMDRVLGNTKDNINTDPYVSNAADELNDAYGYIESLQAAAADLMRWARVMFHELDGGSNDDAYTIKDAFNALFSLKQSGIDLEQGGFTIAEFAEKLKRVAV